ISIPFFSEMLPAKLTVDSERSVTEIPLVLPNTPRLILRSKLGEQFRLVVPEQIPDRPYLTKLTSDERDNAVPLVVQASYGLGRVTFVAFDLDAGPFVDWRHREAFWEWLANTAGHRLPTGAEQATSESRLGEAEDEYLTRMQNNLEFFEGVPVISFGWV